MAIGLAFKAFFRVLFNRQAAQAVEAAFSSIASASSGKPAVPALTSVTRSSSSSEASGTGATANVSANTSTSAKPTGRSDALTLLSTLQREARFLDLVGESLDNFDDAQVGAAARQVLSDVRKTLDRMFAVQPLASDDEGSTIDLPKAASPIRYHLTGRSADQAKRGTLVHRGWKAERCQTPTWNGGRDDAFVLSPVEIEVDG